MSSDLRRNSLEAAVEIYRTAMARPEAASIAYEAARAAALVAREEWDAAQEGVLFAQTGLLEVAL